MRRYLSVSRGLAWRLLHSLVTNPLLFLPPMLMPLFFFTAFAGGLSAVSNVPGFNYGPGYTSFIFAFVLCQSAAFGGVFSGFSIAADFQFGFGRRLLLATPHRSALILGYGIVALFRATITIGVVTLVGLAVGMNIDGGGLDVFGMYALAAIINITGLLFAAGVALRFRSLQATPLMQVPVFLFLFLAPVYVPRAAARRLGPRSRPVQPGDPRDGDRPRPDRRPGEPTTWRRCGIVVGAARGGHHLHVPRPAPGRGRGLAPVRRSARPPALRAVGDEAAPDAAVAGDRSGRHDRSRPGTRARRARPAGEPPGSRLNSGGSRRRPSGPHRPRRRGATRSIARPPGMSPSSRFASAARAATGRTVRRRSQARTLPRHQRQKPQSES